MTQKKLKIKSLKKIKKNPNQRKAPEKKVLQQPISPLTASTTPQAFSQPVIQKSLKRDLSLALQQWESISQQVAKEISPDQKQLKEFKVLLEEVSRKIKAFEA